MNWEARWSTLEWQLERCQRPDASEAEQLQKTVVRAATLEFREELTYHGKKLAEHLGTTFHSGLDTTTLLRQVLSLEEQLMLVGTNPTQRTMKSVRVQLRRAILHRKMRIDIDNTRIHFFYDEKSLERVIISGTTFKGKGMLNDLYAYLRGTLGLVGS